MKKTLAFLTILFCSISLFAQKDFEKGYYIDNSGKKISGLIKVETWSSNPKKITYKPTEMGPQKSIPITNMRGFAIGTSIQYDKFTVKISKASDNLDTMDRKRAFDLVEETAMLKLLVDGEAQLYTYYDEGVTQYFVKKNGLITTLLYKRYMLRSGLASNNQYKQQISNLLRCDVGKLPSPESLSYTSSSLKNYVLEYNACKGFLNENFEVEESKNLLLFKIFGGAQYSSFEVEGTQNRTFDFGDKISIIPGVELELRFPMRNKNIWGIFVDARMHSFDSSVMTPFMQFPSTLTFFRETKAVYDAVDIGLGGRYYISLNENSRLFFGVNATADIITESAITYDNVGIDDIEGRSPTVIFAGGVGYNWKNLAAEFRYHTNRDISEAEQGSSTTTSYSNIVFTISYSFLKTRI